MIFFFLWTLNSVGPNFSYLRVCSLFSGVCFRRTKHNTSESNTSEPNGVIYWSVEIMIDAMNQINKSIQLRLSQWTTWMNRLIWDCPGESDEWIDSIERVPIDRMNELIHLRLSQRIRWRSRFIWECHIESSEGIDSFEIVPVEHVNESVHLRLSQWIMWMNRFIWDHPSEPGELIDSFEIVTQWTDE